ncbi:MAG: DUF2283 domain-containing protein [Dehalococcoidia bacterium]
MSITIGHTTFNQVSYDREADVLYLHVGEPATAVEFDETPEGHALRYDAAGQLVGLTIVNARWLLDQGTPLVITIPERITVDPAALAPVIRPAA